MVEVNFTAEVLRRSLACCMSIQAKMAESGDLEDGDLELPEEKEDEEGLIRYYFFRGFEYKEIRLFLFKNHGIEMKVICRNTAVVSFDCHRSNSSNIISCYHIVQSNILFLHRKNVFSMFVPAISAG